jgi:N6-adenosine-specific RNA methylase IME4
MMKYRTIVADPPWRYASAATKADAEQHYDTMDLLDICALPVPDLAEDDAHLWLWGTNALLEQAYTVTRMWGFSPLTLVTWCKPGPGVGHYLRNNTEHVILASRGRAQVPSEKALSTWYVWPRQPHSQKPDAFFDLVEQISPAPRVELFARRHRFFWDVWGNESANTAQLEARA